MLFVVCWGGTGAASFPLPLETLVQVPFSISCRVSRLPIRIPENGKSVCYDRTYACECVRVCVHTYMNLCIYVQNQSTKMTN